ncbi:hypothetical protein Tco_0115269 [Tanacetum coccineum]
MVGRPPFTPPSSSKPPSRRTSGVGMFLAQPEGTPGSGFAQAPLSPPPRPHPLHRGDQGVLDGRGELASLTSVFRCMEISMVVLTRQRFYSTDSLLKEDPEQSITNCGMLNCVVESKSSHVWVPNYMEEDHSSFDLISKEYVIAERGERGFSIYLYPSGPLKIDNSLNLQVTEPSFSRATKKIARLNLTKPQWDGHRFCDQVDYNRFIGLSRGNRYDEALGTNRCSKSSESADNIQDEYRIVVREEDVSEAKEFMFDIQKGKDQRTYLLESVRALLVGRSYKDGKELYENKGIVRTEIGASTGINPTGTSRMKSRIRTEKGWRMKRTGVSSIRDLPDHQVCPTDSGRLIQTGLGRMTELKFVPHALLANCFIKGSCPLIMVEMRYLVLVGVNSQPCFTLTVFNQRHHDNQKTYNTGFCHSE